MEQQTPESKAHDRMRALAQEIADETGIVIQRADFQWINLDSLDKRASHVQWVRMETETRY